MGAKEFARVSFSLLTSSRMVTLHRGEPPDSLKVTADLSTALGMTNAC